MASSVESKEDAATTAQAQRSQPHLMAQDAKTVDPAKLTALTREVVSSRAFVFEPLSMEAAFHFCGMMMMVYCECAAIGRDPAWLEEWPEKQRGGGRCDFRFTSLQTRETSVSSVANSYGGGRESWMPPSRRRDLERIKYFRFR